MSVFRTSESRYMPGISVERRRVARNRPPRPCPGNASGHPQTVAGGRTIDRRTTPRDGSRNPLTKMGTRKDPTRAKVPRERSGPLYEEDSALSASTRTGRNAGLGWSRRWSCLCLTPFAQA